MNPIEQIWKEIRKRGFRNEIFKALDAVIDRLCDVICSITPKTISSITKRSWMNGIIMVKENSTKKWSKDNELDRIEIRKESRLIIHEKKNI